MNILRTIFTIGEIMKTGPKGFTENEKIKLRELMISTCITSWIEHGYTKTSIAKITRDANIATGSFYLLFDYKEELFYESFLHIQDKLAKRAEEILKHNPSLEGFIQLNLMLYQEYESKPFLYTFNNHDFQLFLNKLNQDQINKLVESNFSSFEESLKMCNLKSKMTDTFTFDTLNILLSTLRSGHETTIPKKDIYETILRATLPQILRENDYDSRN